MTLIVDYIWWDAVGFKNLEHLTSVNRVKSLAKINESYNCFHVIVLQFFDNASEGEDVNCSGPALAKAILVWAENVIIDRSNSVKQAAVVDPRYNLRECNATVVISFLGHLSLV